MAVTELDLARLQRALALARSAIGLSDPNPRVGCVLATADGRICAEGHTQQAGGHHAEAMALQSAAGVDLRGGTAWVSLEPCAHHGRTPPCSDALIAAGLSRVVVVQHDPFPQVAGQGIARLRAAGIQVDLPPPGPITAEADALNVGFFSRIHRGTPWLRLKVAASLDGRTALANGVSQWLTGPEARADGHGWRQRAGAVLTGCGTVLADDPRLDVRLVPAVLQPLRVVVDSRLSTPPAAKLCAPPGQVLIATACPDGPRADALRAVGAEILHLPDGRGRVDLPALCSQLAERGVNELHVEAGATLNAALLQAGLVDELLVYLAPCLVGPGRDLAALPPLARLIDALSLRFIEHQGVGPDLRLRALTERGASFMAR